MFALTFTSLWTKTLWAPFCPGFSHAKLPPAKNDRWPWGRDWLGTQDDKLYFAHMGIIPCILILGERSIRATFCSD